MVPVQASRSIAPCPRSALIINSTQVCRNDLRECVCVYVCVRVCVRGVECVAHVHIDADSTGFFKCGSATVPDTENSDHRPLLVEWLFADT